MRGLTPIPFLLDQLMKSEARDWTWAGGGGGHLKLQK
jgi:hypothetical protein